MPLRKSLEPRVHLDPLARSIVIVAILITFPMSGPTFADALFWPIDCSPDDPACRGRLGLPDVDGDGLAYDCSAPGYTDHQGVDITVRRDDVPVLAAADGVVAFVADDRFDRCPSSHPHCQAPAPDSYEPGQSDGYQTCTLPTLPCGDGYSDCYVCSYGGNLVIVEHDGIPGVRLTRYDHLATDSVSVSVGQRVRAGDVLGVAASAGNSTGPHLHFEVMGSAFGAVEPWGGSCGPNFGADLWRYETPWAAPAYRLPSDTWRQISLPAGLPADRATPPLVFGDDINGEYGSTWTLYGYDPISLSYISPAWNERLDSTMTYWILQSTGDEVVLDLPSAATLPEVEASDACASPRGCSSLPLRKGDDRGNWLMIGNPFRSEVALSELRVVTDDGPCTEGCTMAEAETTDVFLGSLFSYGDGGYETLDAADVLPSWQGVWGRVLSGAEPGSVRLLVPRY